MITLTEKRLQELEQRIPVFLAQISDQQKKMMEIYSFPNDLSEVRKQAQSNESFLKSSLEEMRQAFSELRGQITSTANTGSGTIQNVESLRRNHENLEAIIATHTKQISQLSERVLSLEEKFTLSERKWDVMSHRLDSLESNAKGLQSEVLSIREETRNSKIDNVAVDDRIRQSDAKFSQIADDLRKNLEEMDKKCQEKITEGIRCLEAQGEVNKVKILLEASKSGNYDEKFLELKKDMSSILSIVHSSSTNNSGQEKINEKIKIMEGSIAQVLALMKKYEGQ